MKLLKHPYSKSGPNISREKKAFGEVHRKGVSWLVGFSPLKTFATRLFERASRCYE
jgi:hypothetical protein